MIGYNGFDVPLLDEEEKDTYFKQYQSGILSRWNRLENEKTENDKDKKDKWSFYNEQIIEIILYFIVNFIDNERELLKLQDIVKGQLKVSGKLARNNKDVDKETFFRILKYKDTPLINNENNKLKDHVFDLCGNYDFFKSLQNQIGWSLYNIEKKKNAHLNNLVLKSQEFAKSYRWKSILCFVLAFVWFVLCWFVPIVFDWLRYMFDWQYSLPKDYFGEIFIFLSRLLLKLPSFVLCLVGVKFLYLFVQYKTEEREFSMLDSYLEKLPSGCMTEKAELVKQLAPHFFPDKKANKISQGFFQELILRLAKKD